MTRGTLFRLVRGMPGALLLAVLLGFLFHDWGRSGGHLHSDSVSLIGIFLIFLFQGILLPTQRIASDLAEWKLHALIQGWVFVVTPLITFGLLFLDRLFPWLDPGLRAGFLFLAFLPTTISTANVLVAQAGGNLTASLVNTVVANLTAVVIVPLAVAVFLSTKTGGETGTDGVGGLLLKIGMVIVLPMALGQIFRPIVGKQMESHRKRITFFNNSVIAFLVFVAFSNSVDRGVWEGFGTWRLVTAIAATWGLLVLSKTLLWGTLARLKWSRKDRITAFFCGSQKSLATGVAIANVAFAGSAEIPMGLVVLPLIIYHLSQLILDSELASRWAPVKAS